MYTYAIPLDLKHTVQVGIRVEVSFGKNKLYSGIVFKIHDEKPNYPTKSIISVLDESPIVTSKQLKLWEWISNYYCCTLGEVMSAALPSGLKLSSETRIVLGAFYDEQKDADLLDNNEFMIAEALSLQNELRIEDIKKILNKKTIYPTIKKMLDKNIIHLYEELKEKYKAKTVQCIRLKEPYLSNENQLIKAFELTKNAPKQEAVLLAYYQLIKKKKYILKQEVCNMANANYSVIKALEKKGILESYDKEVSRITEDGESQDAHVLSTQQKLAIEEIDEIFKTKDVVLLHGVTGSGKTRVFVEQIQKVIDNGGQVLYLLPEIALTTQIVSRLQKIFANQIAVYHSRMNANQRVELWKAAQGQKSIIMGARSSLFLPFNKLQLIVVDEEHDASFKQFDPAPRYNARDTAIYMAHLYQAKVILGTATPSLESYKNATSGKYGLVEMKERFGGIQLPEIIIADMKEEYKKRKMQSHFTSILIEKMETTLSNQEQIILFQNRRGYAPTLQCPSCDWKSECIHCDVALTYHKFTEQMRCHYCGYTEHIPRACPACGDTQLMMKGFGTEKIEDELKIYFPDAKIARMDWDTVKGRSALVKIINDFEEKRIDILVGTQMVTKGFDFDNVGLVGILSADQLIHFPDFRANERAFQLMVQVSGRAGRKRQQGKVVIQTFQPTHPTILDVINNDFNHFVNREIQERKDFRYAPYFAMIKIHLKHKQRQIVKDAAKFMAHELSKKYAKYLIGPAEPSIARVRSLYLQDMMLKLPKNASLLQSVKKDIIYIEEELKNQKGYASVRIIVDVDCY